MTYAIVKISGKQYKVAEGDLLKVDLAKNPLNVEVLFLSNGKDLLVSKEDLKDASVTLDVVSEGRGRKLRVGRFKSKSRYKKVSGHRSSYTMVKIASINHSSIEKTEKAEKPVKAVKVKKEVKVTETKAVKAPKKAIEKKPAKAAVKKTTSKKLAETKTEA